MLSPHHGAALNPDNDHCNKVSALVRNANSAKLKYHRTNEALVEANLSFYQYLLALKKKLNLWYLCVTALTVYPETKKTNKKQLLL